MVNSGTYTFDAAPRSRLGPADGPGGHLVVHPRCDSFEPSGDQTCKVRLTVAQKCPVVAECAETIGDPQVRNRGTIGGSLAHVDPSAAMPAVMVALDAEIHLKGSKDWRVVNATAFFQDLFTVDLAPDELIVSVPFAPVKSAG